jgi:hypothetical protein
MPESVVRTRNVVGFGGSVLKGLATAVVGGSIVLGGTQYFDRSQTSTVNIRYGTGSVLSYADVNCTNTGGLAKYNSCYMANPVSGTASIVRIQVDSYKAPKASPITCVTTPIGNTTGTASALIRYFTTFSGSTIGTASGTITGNAVNTTSPRILPGAGVRCWHSTTPGVGLKERMRIWYNATYVP